MPLILLKFYGTSLTFSRCCHFLLYWMKCTFYYVFNNLLSYTSIRAEFWNWFKTNFLNDLETWNFEHGSELDDNNISNLDYRRIVVLDLSRCSITCSNPNINNSNNFFFFSRNKNNGIQLFWYTSYFRSL